MPNLARKLTNGCRSRSTSGASRHYRSEWLRQPQPVLLPNELSRVAAGGEHHSTGRNANCRLAGDSRHPIGMGDARTYSWLSSAGDACIVIGGRAGTISEVCLAWLHKRPLLPLLGCSGWSDSLPANPPDERKNAPVLGWSSLSELEARVWELGLVAG